jgi:hypothetical protein
LEQTAKKEIKAFTFGQLPVRVSLAPMRLHLPLDTGHRPEHLRTDLLLHRYP